MFKEYFTESQKIGDAEVDFEGQAFTTEVRASVTARYEKRERVLKMEYRVYDGSDGEADYLKLEGGTDFSTFYGNKSALYRHIISQADNWYSLARDAWWAYLTARATATIKQEAAG